MREVLAYPSSVEHFDENAFAPVLERLNLARLVPLLDRTLRWDQDLSVDTQQSLVIAGALLRSPRWIFIDEVLDALDESTRNRVIDVLSHDLQQTGIIYIGRIAVHDRLFGRTLHLVKDPNARRLALQAVRAAAPPGTTQTPKKGVNPRRSSAI